MASIKNKAKDGAEKLLSGSVERVVFHNPDNGYSVIRLRADDGRLVTVVGNLGRRHPGEMLKLRGRWRFDSNWGEQFSASEFSVGEPDDLISLQRYLSSELVNGIGEKYAKRLVEHFGKDVLEVIRETPARLREVPGIGAKRAEVIEKAVVAEDRQERTLRELSLLLLDYGIGQARIRTIYRRYGDAAIDILKRDPYRLSEDIRGIGFATADRIARKLHTPLESPSRIRAGLMYVLQKASDDGSCYLPKNELIERAAKILNIAIEPIERGLDGLVERGRAVASGRGIYPARLFDAESRSAEIVAILTNSAATKIDEAAIESGLRKYGAASGIAYTDEQRVAVHMALGGKPMLVITGGPGTGKTTIIDTITKIADGAGLRVALCAPTGRAAKRLSEATGKPASTIHRLLEYTPYEGFGRGRSRPIVAEIVVIDEASMVDIELFAALVSAVKMGTRVVVVGDVDQLPSVGPGQVLADLIGSGTIPTVRLNQIHRQAAESRIVRESYNIIRGQMPKLKNDPAGDFFFISKEDPEEGLELVIDLAARRLPRRYGFDRKNDIQVIVPMYRGICGANAINEKLRDAINLGEPIGDGRFRAGDKVMQTRNNYDLNVFNGDIGIVVSQGERKDQLVVDFGQKLIYDAEAAADLALAYAITAHKSQGGEIPCVIMPIYKEHFILLNRNLLYTAITRAKKLCVIVGQSSALATAVARNNAKHRYSALAERIRKAMKNSGEDLFK